MIKKYLLLETEQGVIQTNLRESPKLMMQEGYIKPVIDKNKAGDYLSELLLNETITEKVFIQQVERQPNEL